MGSPAQIVLFQLIIAQAFHAIGAHVLIMPLLQLIHANVRWDLAVSIVNSLKIRAHRLRVGMVVLVFNWLLADTNAYVMRIILALIASE